MRKSTRPSTSSTGPLQNQRAMPSTTKSLPSNQRHFLDLDRLSKDDLRTIIDVSRALKAGTHPFANSKPLSGKALAMVFEKPSTRTRVSFELGMKRLGG